MSDSNKEKAGGHAQLMKALFKAQVSNGQSIKDDVSFRLGHLVGACDSLAHSLFEANFKSNADISTESIADFLTLVQREIETLKILVEEGLSEANHEAS